MRLAVVEVKNGLGIRATAKLHEGAIIHDTMTTKDLINRHGHGRCAIMLDPKDRREGEALYQGVVPLVGESIADAAKAVGISENNASVKLSRLRTKLKKELEEEGIII